MLYAILPGAHGVRGVLRCVPSVRGVRGVRGVYGVCIVMMYHQLMILLGFHASVRSPTDFDNYLHLLHDLSSVHLFCILSYSNSQSYVSLLF